MKTKVVMDIENMSDNPRKYAVILKFKSGKLWYYGSWNDKNFAKNMAEEADGFVIERED